MIFFPLRNIYTVYLFNVSSKYDLSQSFYSITENVKKNMWDLYGQYPCFLRSAASTKPPCLFKGLSNEFGERAVKHYGRVKHIIYCTNVCHARLFKN